MTIIPRDSYLRELEPFIRKPFIKVLTGIRLLLMEKLRQQGVRETGLSTSILTAWNTWNCATPAMEFHRC
jgi:hypothetical protein